MPPRLDSCRDACPGSSRNTRPCTRHTPESIRGHTIHTAYRNPPIFVNGSVTSVVVVWTRLTESVTVSFRRHSWQVEIADKLFVWPDDLSTDCPFVACVDTKINQPIGLAVRSAFASPFRFGVGNGARVISHSPALEPVTRALITRHELQICWTPLLRSWVNMLKEKHRNKDGY